MCWWLATLSCLIVSQQSLAQDFRDSFVAVTPQNFDAGGPISRQFHLNAQAYLPAVPIHRGGDGKPLPSKLNSPVPNAQIVIDDKPQAFSAYAQSDPLIDAVIVLHGGDIVFEAYPHMRPVERHFAWSVTKVFTSTAAAVLAADGALDMAAPIEQYLPFLKETDWAGTSVQDIADMASGMACLDSEGYQNADACIYRLEESLGITAPTGRDLDFLTVVKGIKRSGPPGVVHEYASANTNVLMLALEAVTGQPFQQVLEDKIWDPMGAEADAFMTVSPQGYGYGSSGLQARLRDVARFGLIFTQPESLDILSLGDVADIQASGVSFSKARQTTLRAEFGDDMPVRSGWQWDFIWADGALYKGGYLGQGLYVDPQRDVVVAWFGTGEDFGAKRNQLLSASRQLALSVAAATD